MNRATLNGHNPMNANYHPAVMIIEHKKETLGEMLNAFKNILFDPISLKWLSGTLLLTVPAFFGEGGTLAGIISAATAVSGAGLVAMSIWEKHHLTRRRNEVHDRKMEVLRLVRSGQLSKELGEWEYSKLDR